MESDWVHWVHLRDVVDVLPVVIRVVGHSVPYSKNEGLQGCKVDFYVPRLLQLAAKA